jgi:site-specific recombinase XerD
MIAITGMRTEDRIKVIRSTFQKLAEYLGHDDAKRVSLVELSSFKTKMLRDYEARAGTRNTVKQLLSPVKVAFKWACSNGKIDTNPAADLTVGNVKVGTRRISPQRRRLRSSPRPVGSKWSNAGSRG